jgi:hypothetical protein
MTTPGRDHSAADRGGGILAIWTDVAPELEADFNEWYWREHFPERLSVPGFLSARRYRAISGAPRYFAWYDLASVETLASTAYRERYDNPTEWTKRVTAGFRSYSRAVFRPLMREGSTAGACILTLRLPAAARAPSPDSLSPLSTATGITRVQLWQAAEPATSVAPPSGADKPPGWAIVVEAVDTEELAAAAPLLQAIGGTGTKATYRFLCGLHLADTMSVQRTR